MLTRPNTSNIHTYIHQLFRKLCARWVPKQLTPEHKVKRMESAFTFLRRYHNIGDEFLGRIITGDETWVAHITSEIKLQSNVSVTVDLPERQNSSRLCRRGKWCAWYSGTDGAFSSSTSWPEVKRRILSVIAKHWRNYDGSFRTNRAGSLVSMLSCCTITLGHTRFGGQQIFCRSSVERCLLIRPIART